MSVAVGDKVTIQGREEIGVVKFVGTTSFASGNWVGAVLPTPTGKNDGSVKGVSYFKCKPNHGVFVKEELVTKVKGADVGGRTGLVKEKGSKAKKEKGVKAVEPADGDNHPEGEGEEEIGRRVSETRAIPVFGGDENLGDDVDADGGGGDEEEAAAEEESESLEGMLLLKAELQKIEAEIFEKQAAVEKAENELAEREEAVKEREQAVAGGGGGGGADVEVIAQLREENSKLGKRISEIETEMYEAASVAAEEITELETEIATLKGTVQSKEEEVKTLIQQADEKEKTTEKGGRGEKIAEEAATEAENQTSKIVTALQGEIDELQAALAAQLIELTESRAETKLHMEAMAELQQDYATKEEEWKKKEEEMKLQQQQQEATEKKKDEEAKMKEEKEKKKEEENTSQLLSKAEEGELRSKLAAAEASLAKQVKEEKKKSKGLEEQVADLSQQVESLNGMVEMLSMDKELSAETAETLQAEVDLLQDQLTESREDVEKLKQANSASKEALLSELPTEQAEVARIVKQNESLSDALRQVRDLSVKEAERFAVTLASKEERLHELQSASAALALLQLQHAKAVKDVKELKEELDESAEMAEMAEELTLTNAALQEKVAEFQRTVADLSALKETSEEVEQYHLELQATQQTELTQLERKMAKMQEQLNEKTMQLTDQEATVTRFASLLEQLRQELHGAQYQAKMAAKLGEMHSGENTVLEQKQATALKQSHGLVRRMKVETYGAQMETLQYKRAMQFLAQYLPPTLLKQADFASLALLLFLARMTHKSQLCLQLLSAASTADVSLAIVPANSGSSSSSKASDENMTHVFTATHLCLSAYHLLQLLYFLLQRCVDSEYSALATSSCQEGGIMTAEASFDNLLLLLSSSSAASSSSSLFSSSSSLEPLRSSIDLLTSCIASHFPACFAAPPLSATSSAVSAASSADLFLSTPSTPFYCHPAFPSSATGLPVFSRRLLLLMQECASLNGMVANALVTITLPAAPSSSSSSSVVSSPGRDKKGGAGKEQGGEQEKKKEDMNYKPISVVTVTGVSSLLEQLDSLHNGALALVTKADADMNRLAAGASASSMGTNRTYAVSDTQLSLLDPVLSSPELEREAGLLFLVSPSSNNGSSKGLQSLLCNLSSSRGFPVSATAGTAGVGGSNAGSEQGTSSNSSHGWSQVIPTEVDVSLFSVCTPATITALHACFLSLLDHRKLLQTVLQMTRALAGGGSWMDAQALEEQVTSLLQQLVQSSFLFTTLNPQAPRSVIAATGEDAQFPLAPVGPACLAVLAQQLQKSNVVAAKALGTSSSSAQTWALDGMYATAPWCHAGVTAAKSLQGVTDVADELKRQQDDLTVKTQEIFTLQKKDRDLHAKCDVLEAAMKVWQAKAIAVEEQEAALLKYKKQQEQSRAGMETLSRELERCEEENRKLAKLVAQGGNKAGAQQGGVGQDGSAVSPAAGAGGMKRGAQGGGIGYGAVATLSDSEVLLDTIRVLRLQLAGAQTAALSSSNLLASLSTLSSPAVFTPRAPASTAAAISVEDAALGRPEKSKKQPFFSAAEPHKCAAHLTQLHCQAVSLSSRVGLLSSGPKLVRLAPAVNVAASDRSTATSAASTAVSTTVATTEQTASQQWHRQQLELSSMRKECGDISRAMSVMLSLHGRTSEPIAVCTTIPPVSSAGGGGKGGKEGKMGSFTERMQLFGKVSCFTARQPAGKGDKQQTPTACQNTQTLYIQRLPLSSC